MIGSAPPMEGSDRRERPRGRRSHVSRRSDQSGRQRDDPGLLVGRAIVLGASERGGRHRTGDYVRIIRQDGADLLGFVEEVTPMTSRV